MESSRREILMKMRRKCIRGFVDVIILNLLREKSMCGYEIIESIYKKIQVLLSPGTVYPLLGSLQRRGLIESKTDGKKRVYKLTSDGKEAFLSMSAEYVKIQSVFSMGFGLGRNLQTLSQGSLGMEDEQ